MILITGATGFIGKELIKHLSLWNKKVRILLTPSDTSIQLPKKIPVEIVISNLNDEKNLRAACKDVQIIYHLATDEPQGIRAQLQTVDVQGTASLVHTAQESNVKQIIYVSHLGAEPSSAFPLLNAKGKAEKNILQSGIPYTIFKTGPIFGTGDYFISRLRMILNSLPGVAILPDKGQSLLHPIWLNDVITALKLSIEDSGYQNKVYSIGGPEYFSYKELCGMVMAAAKMKRVYLPIPSNTIRALLMVLEPFQKNIHYSLFDLDYLAIDRTAPLDTLPKFFGILPSRLSTYLDIP